MRQYGNSARFRMLKWLHPLLMTTVFMAIWFGHYVPKYHIEVQHGRHIFAVVAYVLVLIGLLKTYHALTVGLQRVSELVYSQMLALLICAGGFYILETLLCDRVLSILPIMTALTLQFVLCILWSLVANRVYYTWYPAPKTAVIYRKPSDLQQIRSIHYFEDRFDVQKVIEDPTDAKALCREIADCQAIFVAGINEKLRNKLAKYCVEQDIKGYFVPHLGDILMAGAKHMSMFSEPVVKVQRAQRKTEYLALKRVLDVLSSFLGLVVISPVMLGVALAIKIYDKGPVLYKQKRLTQNGQVFSILKFRSMKVDAEADGVARLASENDSRITPVGKFIRATRLDELPQLINILRGDMSLVGPRPERPEIADEYRETLPEFSLRLQVKAGLTGMAQVYGRYNTDPYSKLQMDLMYINEISLRTDVRLLFMTLKILFVRDSTAGVEDGSRTAAKSKKSA